MRNPQLKFQDKQMRQEMAFGGTLMRSRKGRKARPISSKDPMHLVLRSSKAKGALGFGHTKNVSRVKQVIDQHCQRYGVKLIQYSNNFNHLHLMVKFPSRAVYLRFIRSLTGSLALAVTGASKIKSLKEKFWDFRPFTRVIRSLRGYKIVRDYVTLNQLEALEILPKRSGRLREVENGERHHFRYRAVTA